MDEDRDLEELEQEEQEFELRTQKVCPDDGYLEDEDGRCPECGKPL